MRRPRGSSSTPSSRGRTSPTPASRRSRRVSLTSTAGPPSPCGSCGWPKSEADGNLDAARENVAWFHMRVGDELARVGRADDARKSYLEALSLYPHDYKTMTGLARLAAGRQDWPGTISWGLKAEQVVPTPEAVALVGDAYAASGDRKDAEGQYRLIEAMGTLSRAQSMVYDRYRAMFDANHGRHLEEGLGLARREMKARQDVYAYDTLAWASYKNGLLPSGRRRHEAGTRTRHAGRTAVLPCGHHRRGAGGPGAVGQRTSPAPPSLDPYFRPSAPAVAQHPYGGF